MKNTTNILTKSTILIFLALLSVSSRSLQSEIVTLTAQTTAGIVPGEFGPVNPKVRNSKTLRLAAGQTAKILHFYCISNRGSGFGPFAPQGPSVSDAIGLTVTFEDLLVVYTHSTLFGEFANFGAATGSNNNGVAAGYPPEFVGPATIQLTFGSLLESASGGETDARAICTVEVSGTANLSAADGVKLPTVSAVVKANLNGPVEILLESSKDNEKTWEPAEPGVYGETEKQRFFRLRAEPR